MSTAGPLRTLLVVSLAAAALCPSARASAWELEARADGRTGVVVLEIVLLA